MNMKGRTARPESLGAESIVGLRSANSTALERRLVQDTLLAAAFSLARATLIGGKSFHRNRRPASPNFAWRGQ
jgi:hypothetical protein